MDTFSKSNSDRKIRKPLIEKKRRARINGSLEQLKQTLLKNTVAITQGSRPTKLEKADILEMTVRYIHVLHKRLSIVNSNGDCVSSTTSEQILPSSLSPQSCSGSTLSINGAKSKNNDSINVDGDEDKENKMPKLVRVNNHCDVSSGLQQQKDGRVAFKTLADKNIQNDRCWRPW